MFFLLCSLGNNPEERVSLASDIKPTNAGDTKVMAPFGVILIRNFVVLCCVCSCFKLKIVTSDHLESV